MLSIIIVNWNTGELLAKCLVSLAQLPEDERKLIDEVIVVDNASRDRSYVQAQTVVGRYRNKPRVRFVPLTQNVGFAAGNNLGIERVREKNPHAHVLLLNPDTEVLTGAIQELVAALERHPKAGIVGPTLLNTDGSLQPSVRSFPAFRTLLLYMLKLGFVRERLEPDTNDYANEHWVDQVMGAAFLIRNQTFRDIGMLDAGYFLWFEEVDFCRRALLVGWKTLYTPRAQVVHHGGISFSQLIGFRKTMPWLRSTIRYARRHLGSAAAGVLMLLTPLYLVLSVPAGAYHWWKR